ncbi:MAG TPA: 2-oxoacid:acceptor oxidoreductase subunit alpha [Gemmatimonadaceae bacterium]|nr:2-oxoacid:acceptor oxidoreductase subunit alpha [Gemmatimonadaceae bacterium]
MSQINDFAFKIATVNGTGSASANNLLMTSIFRMGIPVTGKNIFPSNIQGLPTWYEIRVSGDGWNARRAQIDLVVAMNPETYKKDVAAVTSGGYLMYDSSWPLPSELEREDITVLGVPCGKMCVEAFERDRDRVLLRNIVYTGALAALLDIDMNVVDELLKEKFSKKQKLLDANYKAVRLGYDYAKANFTCPLPFSLKALNKTKDYVLMDGNTAFGLGAVFAGATVGAWYPITPSTSLMDAFGAFCKQYRTNADGTKNYVIIQAEDELSAAGMVIGANWAGARAFTSTAGPGIDLMSEFIGLAYYAEVPAVFVDVQRVGPSTGMPTRTQQGDIMLCAYASHGDTKHICLYPSDPKECFEMAPVAFDLAERFQTPVFVLSDLDIGMNDWMIPRLQWDDSYVPDRGPVLTAEQVEKMGKWGRYQDTGGGIPSRTLPGTGGKGAFFTRGSGHNLNAAYTEDSDEYQAVMERLKLKLQTAANAVPKPIIQKAGKGNADIGIIALGGTNGAVREAIDRLTKQGIACDYMRLRGFPFGDEVLEFLESHETVFVVEQNRDAQLRSMLMIETATAPSKLISVLDYNGLPLAPKVVVDAVVAQMAGVQS